MSDTVLVARSGRQTGSPESRRLRRADVIPAVVYGLGMDPISVSVDRRDLRLALSGPAGMNTVLELQVDGTTYPAIVKEMQRHPVKRTVSHIDFLQVNLDVEITVGVPVRLEGEAKDVALNGGLVDQQLTEIQVRTTPRIIPDEFLIDISSMTVDTVITVGDVAMPSGVAAVTDTDQPVVTVTMLRTAAGQASSEAAGDEGEAGEDASGEESPADSAE
jgi:large subunit ribosomal protein L25